MSKKEQKLVKEYIKKCLKIEIEEDLNWGTGVDSVRTITVKLMLEDEKISSDEILIGG